jgi:hypothetical protein
VTIESGGILWAAILGAVGGFALGLLQDSGLEFPDLVSGKNGRFLKLGFLAPVAVGALAAVISYLLSLPKDLPQFIVLAITSGLGGSGILKGYVNGKKAVNAEANRQALRADVAGVLQQTQGPQIAGGSAPAPDVPGQLRRALDNDDARTRTANAVTF